MKKSRTVPHPSAVESPRHLPLVELLVDARTELFETRDPVGTDRRCWKRYWIGRRSAVRATHMSLTARLWGPAPWQGEGVLGGRQRCRTATARVERAEVKHPPETKG